MKRLVTLSALSVLAAGVLASAGALAQAAMTEGSVEKIDQAAGKITLNHGPIKNLDMDAMKMVFRVKEASMLDGLRRVSNAGRAWLPSRERLRCGWRNGSQRYGQHDRFADRFRVGDHARAKGLNMNDAYDPAMLGRAWEVTK